MDPRLTLAAVALVAAAPFPALAQTWPAAVVSVAPRLAAQARWLTLPDEPQARLAQSTATTPVKLNLRAPRPAPDLPDVKVPAKAAWSDDDGFRFDFNKVSYKQRF